MTNLVFQGVNLSEVAKTDQAAAAPAIEVPEGVKVWQIGVDSANVQSWNNFQRNQGYRLFCRTNNKFLINTPQAMGINLGFGEGQNELHFRLPDGAERDILSGESVALGIGLGKAFLCYSHRSIGINLDWSDACFQWRIFGPGGLGTPIPEDTPVAILNDKVLPNPDFLIPFDQGPGTGAIGWTSSPGFWGQFGDLIDKHKVDIAKAAIAALI